jgi:hypothetical protein
MFLTMANKKEGKKGGEGRTSELQPLWFVSVSGRNQKRMFDDVAMKTGLVGKGLRKVGCPT